MHEPIVILKSKKKSYYIMLAGAILLAASYLSFAYAEDNVFGWIFLIAAALIMILGIANFIDRKPQLILTEKGITEPFSIKEEIEWNAILFVDDFFYRGQDIVRLLVPKNYKPDLIRPNWFWRLNQIYDQQGLKALYIRVSGLDINSHQLISLIKKKMNSHHTQIEVNQMALCPYCNDQAYSSSSLSVKLIE